MPFFIATLCGFYLWSHGCSGVSVIHAGLVQDPVDKSRVNSSNDVLHATGGATWQCVRVPFVCVVFFNCDDDSSTERQKKHHVDIDLHAYMHVFITQSDTHV
jgi:hypothetical protein